MYSFKDITGKDVKDIVDVSINHSNMSSIRDYEKDYKNLFDINYFISDIEYNEVINMKNNYDYRLFVDFNKDDFSNIDVDFYVYKHKLYYFSKEALYESIIKINYNQFKENNIPENKEKTIYVSVSYDYGVYNENKVTLLLDGNLLWFDPSDYEVDSLIAGDELVIKYTGEYIYEESYPGNVDKDKINIISIEVNKSLITEFVIYEHFNNKYIESIIPDYYDFTLLNREGFVITKDGNIEKYKNYKTGTILYGSIPSTRNSIRVDALYDFYPR